MTQKFIMVEMEKVEARAKNIDSLAGDYKAEYEKFYKEMQNMSSHWSGKEMEAFLAKINEFKKDFEKMHNLMTQYSDFMKKAAESYRKSQDELTKKAHGLTNS